MTDTSENSNATPLDVGRFASILTEQRTVYRSLQTLSERQGGLIASGDTSSLLDLLTQRQQVVERLTEINGQSEPYKAQWSTFWGGLTTEQRDQLRGLIGDVQDLIDAIMSQDEKDYNELERSRDQVGADVQHVHRGTAGHRAYVRPAAVEAKYADHQG
jgi:hypothetical protein